MSFLESKSWKSFMAKAYGIGAAVVITGALFKIMHFPYSGSILTLGMSVEAVIFLISAFEPLPKDYHWETIFPELLADQDLSAPVSAISTPRQSMPHLGGVSAGNFNIDIDRSTTDDLKSGIKKFTDSIGQMSNLSTVVDASAELAGNMHKVSASMVTMSDSTHMLSDSYQKNVQIVQQFNDQSKMGLEQMRSGYEFYRGQLETLGRTMGAVNSSYELYLQEAKKVQTDYSILHGEMGKLLGHVQTSVDETQKFGTQISNLNTNIGHLNSIYGSMLTAVNTVLNK